MGKSEKIIRKSIHTFLQNYHFFTSMAALLALPFSLSLLLSQAFIFSSFSHLPSRYLRRRTLFDAAGFPSSKLCNFLVHKLAETLSSSFLSLPFSLTFLLISKSSVIQFLNRHENGFPLSFSSSISLYKPLLLTSLCNLLFTISVNATVFSLLFFVFNFAQEFSVSSSIFFLFFYSIVLANALMVCNLALVLSGMENHGGFSAICKACILIRGRTSIALSLSLPINIVLASIESLFRYRVVRVFLHRDKNGGLSTITEAIFIAYLHSILVVLDTIMSTLFFKTCEEDFWINFERRRSTTRSSMADFAEEDDSCFKSKA